MFDSRSLLTLLYSTLLMLPALSAEPLNRGLVAIQKDEQSVFISWRMRSDDTHNTSYELYRTIDNSTEKEKLALPNEGRVTCFQDENIKANQKYTYTLHVQDSKTKEPPMAVMVETRETAQSYISIPLQGDYDFQKVGLGDLDGDGELEYLIKQPDFNTDPYQQPGYWKPSTTTYKIEAYKRDGTHLWTYDMGWAIEAGIWYAPWIVYDVDQDGKAEVYCKAGEGDPRDEKGLVQSGPEYLVKIDGMTGKVIAKTDWPSREGFSDYNYYCRNFLSVAYLDGKNPSLIIQRGTYNLIKLQALDKDLKQIWYWEANDDYKKYRGQSSHGLLSVDVDEDGKDELVMGAAVIDDNGQPLWTLGMGHPDVCYVADIDQDNPGLEIYYGFEVKQETDGICLVDAKTGKKLWTHKKPTRHIHGQGMVGDILAEYPGMETFSGERDFKERFLYSSKGELIQFIEEMDLSPRPVWWDADEQKEVYLKKSICNWGEESGQPIEGKLALVVDCLGDAREEIITALKGELRVYSTTIPTEKVRPCLLQDHQYRMGIAGQTMGYYYPAQLSLSK